MSDQRQGIVARAGRRGWILADPARPARGAPIEIPPELVRAHGLGAGARVVGQVRTGRGRARLAQIETIGGVPPETFRRRTPLRQLTPVDPHERFRLARADETSMRIVDLVAPIGRGTRALIVSPAKAGKTMLLKQMAGAIHADDPETRILVLLVDERPEEVTDFRRAVAAEVWASSNDRNADEHIALIELALAHAQYELECGQDLVVLIDSLTRMGRVYNVRGSGTGRTMSGGVEAGVLEMPRRFFGLARKIEGGGSVTIVATTLVDTGSRMDQLIFEEFKGTGNCEIVLSRELAEARLFPAINLPASGTRKEEQLYEEEEARRVSALRRVLAGRKPLPAMRGMLNLLERFPTNRELLANIPV